MVYNASSRYKLELLFSLNKFNEKNLILNWHRRKCHLLDDILSKNFPLKGDIFRYFQKSTNKPLQYEIFLLILQLKR